MKSRKQLSIILAIASGLLLSVTLYLGYTENNFNYWGIGSNVLICVAMTSNAIILSKADRKERS